MTKKKGRGVSCIIYGFGFGFGFSVPATARVSLASDGRCQVEVGVVDCGQGADTIVAQIVSERLGIPVELVEVNSGTSSVPEIGTSCASRTTYAAGNAVRLATEDLVARVLSLAERNMRLPPGALDVGGGEVRPVGGTAASIRLTDLLAEFAHGQLTGQATFIEPETTDLDPQDGHCDPFYGYAFACHVAEVEVDTETGCVSVTRLIAAQDVGKALNPLAIEGQIIGGSVMGLGYALMEETACNEVGVLHTDTYTTYRIPTVADVPEIIPLIVEDPLPSGPFGAKGVGEPPTIAAAPAIINAIRDAVGIDLFELPATPARVLAALSALDRESATP